jgi:hypothetical protein
MANVDVVENNGEKLYLMNVTEAVGPNYGLSDDVVLVKALLNIVLSMNAYPADKLPDPNSGTLDKKTKDGIKAWQQRFNQLCESNGNPNRLSVDGRVSRARGKFSWDKNRPWTIVTLNSFAGEYCRLYGYKNAADFIAATYPHLAGILKLDPSTF